MTEIIAILLILILIIQELAYASEKHKNYKLTYLIVPLLICFSLFVFREILLILAV